MKKVIQYKAQTTGVSGNTKYTCQSSRFFELKELKQKKRQEPKEV